MIPPDRGVRQERGSRPWGLGQAAPFLLVLFWLASVALRIASPEVFVPNPITTALRHPAPHASFRANYVGFNTEFVGDAANEANLKPTEGRTPLLFSTDALGFRRNPFLPAGAPPEILMLHGASFGFGAALSDSETLEAQLTQRSGMPTYGAHRYHEDPVMTPDDLDWLLDHLPGTPRVAVLVQLEHVYPEKPPSTSLARTISRKQPGLAGLIEEARQLKHAAAEGARQLRRWWSFSPIEVAAARLRKALSDDRILPNEYRHGTRELQLPDGRMVLRRYELRPARVGASAGSVGKTVEYLTWWRDELADRGIDAHVLLMPTRYTVYGPYLETGPALAQIRTAAAYVDMLESALESQGLRTTNGLTVFQRHAAEEIRTGDLSFYREDNHWNPKGVRRIADALAADLEAPADRQPDRLTRPRMDTRTLTVSIR